MTKSLLCLIFTALFIFTLAACSESESGENPAQSNADPQTDGEPLAVAGETEEQEPEEILCECEICKNPNYHLDSVVEINFKGDNIKIPVYITYPIICEGLFLAEKAINFIIALDNDFENTFEQIKDKENAESNIIWGFLNNSEGELLSIVKANVDSRSRGDNSRYRVELALAFSDVDRLLWDNIEFIKEEDDWIINSMYVSMG